MASLPALDDALRSPPSVMVLVGSESLLVREAEAAVRAVLAAGPMAAFNHAVFTAGEEAALGFADAARTVPMMSARRLVEVRQVQDANVALLDALLAYVAAPVASTTLLLTGEKFPAASGGADRGIRIVNAVKKTGLHLKLDGEGVRPAEFAMTRARSLGVVLDRAAADELVATGGGELAILVADLEKCADYVGPGGTIDRGIVREVCASTADADGWALTGSIIERNRNLALETMHRLLEEGEPSHKLMASVAWQLRQVLLVQDAMKRGLSDRDSGVRMRPDTARAVRSLLQEKPISPSALLEEVAVAARRMNSSRAGDRRVFEALILRLTEL